MLNYSNRSAAFGLVVCMALGSTAEAAKGVKKAGANGQQTVNGEIVNVQQNNGIGSFSLRASNRHGKQAAAAGKQRQTREFQVTAATRFTAPAGMPASLAALRQGERVRVQANGQQAQHVSILTSHGVNHRRGYGYHRHYRRGRVHRHRPRMHAVHRHQHHSGGRHHAHHRRK